MAGSAKPNISYLGDEATYTLLGGSGRSPATPSGLFNGVQANEWNTVNVMYWYDSTNYVELDIITEKVNIWRSGTSSWSTTTGSLKIQKWNGSSYDDVTNMYPQTLTAITEKQWEKTISNLPKGRYKFSFNSVTRIDSEWYIEGNYKYYNFILHDEKYKKITNGIPYSKGAYSMYPSIPLTSNTSSEVTVSADAFRANNDPYKALNGDTSAVSTNGWYMSDAPVDGYHWFKLNLTKPIYLGKLEFYNFLYSGTTYTTKDWKIEGSNDDISYFKIYSDTLLSTGTIQTFNIDSTIQYKYFKISVLNNYANSTPNFAGFYQLNVYEKAIDTLATESKIEYFSTTQPTIEQFISDGISDLSALDGKSIVKNIMMNEDVNGGTGETLDNGKVFKKNINSTTYGEIINLKVK